MKNVILAVVMIVASLPALAQHRRPGPGRYNPAPGRHHPGPGRHHPGPGRYHPRPGRHHPGPGRHYPMPRPAPTLSCQVAMVDGYNRVVRRFWGHTDYRTGQCRDALQQCSWEVRRMGSWNYRCAQVRY